MLVSIGFHSLYLPKNSLWMLQKDIIFLTIFFLVYCPSGSYWKASIIWCLQFDLVTMKLNLTCWCQWGSIHYVCQKIPGEYCRKTRYFWQTFFLFILLPFWVLFLTSHQGSKRGYISESPKKSVFVMYLCYLKIFTL